MIRLADIIKSPNDKNLYRAIRLKNSLDCILISDKLTDKSAASLSIGIGTNHQGKKRQGLAHFLQHMLFMGNQKYPKQNQYQQYLTMNSGYSNAYTNNHQTNYHFEVANKAFQDALDRFSQFFIKPLFNQNSLKKQMNAVHSQYLKNQQNDFWRQYQLLRFASKPESVFHSFNTGNLKTLNVPTIREEILSFYQKYYSSNLMKLVVCSSYDIQDLQKLVQQKFSNIQNKNLPFCGFQESVFNAEYLKKIYKIVPVKNINKIQFKFFFQDLSANYKNCPLNYLSHLLGHQGPNSLLSILIEEGLALQIITSSHTQYFYFSYLQIQVILTDKGISQYKNVIYIVGKYIKMLREKGVNQMVFNQIKKSLQLKFQNKDRKSAINSSLTLSSNMHYYPIEYVQIKNFLMQQYKPQLIKNIINKLKLQNSIIFVCSKSFQSQCTQIQQIYGTKYINKNIDNQIICGYNQPSIMTVKQLDLPPQNLFFPKSLFIFQNKQPTQHPKIIYKTQHCNLYYKQDHQFNLPKTSIMLDLNFKTESNARNECLIKIVQKMMKNWIRQLVYMGQQAYMYTSIMFKISSLQIQFFGFNDSMKILLLQVLDRFIQFSPISAGHFKEIVSQLENEFLNLQLKKPYEIAYYHLNLVIKHNLQNQSEKLLAQLKNITLQQTQEWYKNLLNTIAGDILILGNMNKQDAIDITNIFQQKICKNSYILNPQNFLQIRTICIPVRSRWFITKDVLLKDQKNSCLINYFQYKQLNPFSLMMIELIKLFIQQPAFDYLRTKEQIGYIILCLIEDLRGILGLNILIQSSVKCPSEISFYVNNLIKFIQQKKYKQSLRLKKEEKQKKLIDEKIRFFKQIKNHSYLFNRKQLNIQALKKFDIDTFKRQIQLLLIDNYKILQIQLIASMHKEKNQEVNKVRIQKNQIKNGIHYKNIQRMFSLYPDYYAML